MAPGPKDPESASPMDGTQPQQTNQHDAASQAADLAQAYKDLARGEQAATALENHLTSLERRLDELLAAMEAAEPGLEGSGEEPASDAKMSRKTGNEKDGP